MKLKIEATSAKQRENQVKKDSKAEKPNPRLLILFPFFYFSFLTMLWRPNQSGTRDRGGERFPLYRAGQGEAVVVL